MRRAVFLDRDGTLIRDKHYMKLASDVELFPESIPALGLLRRAGLAIVVITNQSGIGRGLLSEANLRAQHVRLRGLLAAGSVSLDGIYHCPHLPPEAEGDYGCDCRKPGTALLERAAAELNLSLAGSWVVGDKAADIELAAALPLRAILVRTGRGCETEAEIGGDACEAIRDNLLGAARYIADQEAEL